MTRITRLRKSNTEHGYALLLGMAWLLQSGCSASMPARGPGAVAPVSTTGIAAPFVASGEQPFARQMMDTMALMDRGMAAAPMNGDPNHDFVTMMIPHHQGGIDMAKVLLVQGTDPEMRRLAQAIVTDQQNEIELMQLWLSRHPEQPIVSDHRENR